MPRCTPFLTRHKHLSPFQELARAHVVRSPYKYRETFALSAHHTLPPPTTISLHCLSPQLMYYEVSPMPGVSRILLTSKYNTQQVLIQVVSPAVSVHIPRPRIYSLHVSTLGSTCPTSCSTWLYVLVQQLVDRYQVSSASLETLSVGMWDAP